MVMMFTWERPSKRFQISKNDIKRITITVWLIAIPMLTYIIRQLQYGEAIDMATAIATGWAVMLSMLEQFLRNNQSNGWPITII